MTQLYYKSRFPRPLVVAALALLSWGAVVVMAVAVWNALSAVLA